MKVDSERQLSSWTRFHFVRRDKRRLLSQKICFRGQAKVLRCFGCAYDVSIYGSNSRKNQYRCRQKEVSIRNRADPTVWGREPCGVSFADCGHVANLQHGNWRSWATFGSVWRTYRGSGGFVTSQTRVSDKSLLIHRNRPAGQLRHVENLHAQRLGSATHNLEGEPVATYR